MFVFNHCMNGVARCGKTHVHADMNVGLYSYVLQMLVVGIISR